MTNYELGPELSVGERRGEEEEAILFSTQVTTSVPGGLFRGGTPLSRAATYEKQQLAVVVER